MCKFITLVIAPLPIEERTRLGIGKKYIVSFIKETDLPGVPKTGEVDPNSWESE
jgi:hypothetical protein